jgi:two-component system sensor histidine kinase/response regulator
MQEPLVIKVLYVDDEEHNLISFTSTFRKVFKIFTAKSALEAEIILQREKDIHVLITDQKMPVKKGTELLQDAVIRFPKQSRIIITAYTDDDAVRDAEKTGLIYRYTSKPWNEGELKEFIIEGYDLFYSKVLQQQRLERKQLSEDDFNKSIKKRK